MAMSLTRSMLRLPSWMARCQICVSRILTLLEIRSKGSVSRHDHVQTSSDRGSIGLGGPPIAHDESSKAKLSLEDLSQSSIVLASIGVVDLVVAAHDGSNSGLDGPQEWVSVQLVDGSIVDVGRLLVPEMLLLVSDVVLGVGHHSLALNTLDGGNSTLSSQVRISSESLPVSSSSGHSSLCIVSFRKLIKPAFTRRHIAE